MRDEELDQNPSYQLWQASNAWQRTIRRAMSSIGLTYVQLLLLGATHLLSSRGMIVTQRQIARCTSIDENMTSQVVRSLVEKGWITREPHPEDARAYRIELTDAGQALVEKAKALLVPLREEFFSPLEGREVELAEMLRKITAHSERDIAHE
jgi:DNA-binding MarR family transcriptional regulator